MEAAAILLVISLGSVMVVQHMRKEIKFQTPSCTTEMYGNLESHSSEWQNCYELQQPESSSAVSCYAKHL